MRVPLFAVLLAVAAVPVPALASEVEDGGLGDAAAAMADPARQQQVATMAQAMLGMLMEMPVGPMLQSAARMRGEDPAAIDPDTRIADLAGPQAQDMPGEVAARVPQMMGAMAQMAGAFEAMLPQLRAMAESLPRGE